MYDESVEQNKSVIETSCCPSLPSAGAECQIEVEQEHDGDLLLLSLPAFCKCRVSDRIGTRA